MKSQLRQLEQSLQKEVTSRTEREAELKREVERKLADISTYSDEGFGSVRKLNEVRMRWTAAGGISQGCLVGHKIFPTNVTIYLHIFTGITGET